MPPVSGDDPQIPPGLRRFFAELDGVAERTIDLTKTDAGMAQLMQEMRAEFREESELPASELPTEEIEKEEMTEMIKDLSRLRALRHRVTAFVALHRDRIRIAALVALALLVLAAMLDSR